MLLIAYYFIAVPSIFPQQLRIYLTCTWHQLVIALSITRRAHLKRKKYVISIKINHKNINFQNKKRKTFLGENVLSNTTPDQPEILFNQINSGYGITFTEQISQGAHDNPAWTLSPAGFPSWIPKPPASQEESLWRLSASGKMMFSSQQDIRVSQCTD